MTVRPIPDPATVACLGGGWHAAYCISGDGTPWPWLLTTHSRGGRNGCHDKCCAPHEQDGRLPATHRRRLNRCTAVTKTSGQQCRNPAPIGQTRCRLHNPTQKGTPA